MIKAYGSFRYLGRVGRAISAGWHRSLDQGIAVLVVLVLAGTSEQVQAVRYVADLPECQTAAFQALLQIDHAQGDFAALEAQLPLVARCTLPPEADRQQSTVARPSQGVINFETPHVHPLALTPSGQKLLAVNTVANTLEVFDSTGGQLSWRDSIPVGHDPVTVRVRSEQEAWVVNKISDSISVVDLDLGTVIHTLQTDNEPADVVFAAGQQRAFVSSGEKNRVLVYSLSDLQAEPQRLPLLMEEPRALAISPDGATVYVATFESGNATTALSGRPAAAATGSSADIVSRADGPYSGQNPAPNMGANFEPALTAGDPGVSSLVVRRGDSGQWMDDNNRDWSNYISGSQASLSGRVNGWDLPDYDLAHINTQSLAITYSSRLMNINAAVAVNPGDGRVTLVGTDATNEIRFQPNLNGKFLRVVYATVIPGQSPEVADLNPHLDYSLTTLPADQRAASIGDPRGVAWAPAGDRFFVSGMGSNNVVAVAADGSRLGRLEVQEGPTGLVLSADGDRAFVLSKFAGSVSEFDPETLQVRHSVSFFDPTPESIKLGRPHLYNTHQGSGLGHLSCASCHVDARGDRLAWDLGEPNGAPNSSAHPMKGSMQTQSLVDIMRFPSFHWRGDRLEMLDFNPTFTLLQGADSQLNGLEIAQLEGFLRTLYFPPNPYRNLDNTLSEHVELPAGVGAATGNAVIGREKLNACIGCHSNGLPRSNESVALFGQSFIPQGYHGLYKRLGYNGASAQGSTSGFGAFHDGADGWMAVARSADHLAALMSFEGPDNDLAPTQSRQDTHAAVGKQVTLAGSSAVEQQVLLAQMLELSSSPHLELIAKRGGEINRRGYLYLGDGQWQADFADERVLHSTLVASADANHPVTFTLVVAGTGQRLALDRDLDGIYDHASGNHAPVFGFTGIRASVVNQPESYQLPVVDAEGDTLSFSAQGLPLGLFLDAQTGLISDTPTELGEFEVLVSVRDADGGDQIKVIWRVLETLPVIPAVEGGAASPLAFLWLMLWVITRARVAPIVKN
ncbi:MAG: beta-propeller fold lactonase family protein [Granulosicoccaceae bacterium]